MIKLGSGGLGAGAVKLSVLAGNPSTPEDEADIGINAFATDVRSISNADYTGELMLRTAIRITDLSTAPHLNEPATVTDLQLSLPFGCEPTAGAGGSACTVNTTADTLVPGFTREGARALISTYSFEVTDAGDDGVIDGGDGCPLDCGTGDEKLFLRQGLFAP